MVRPFIRHYFALRKARKTPAVSLALTALVAVLAATSPLDRQVDGAASHNGFTGAVAVTRNGKLVFARGYGLADRAHRRKATIDTAFNLASMGKMFTGVAAAQLVQAKKLRFDDPVGKYVPGLPRRLRPLTIAQLLDHTSGLGDYFDDPGYDRLRPRLTSLAAYLPLVARESLQFRPGARWSYSNSGFLLAGLAIEHASGERYDTYLARHVWGPAGMTHTGCYSRTHLPSFAAVGYDGDLPNTATLPPEGTSAGGCYSSARDLLRFAAALESGKLLDRVLVTTITTSRVAAPGGGYGYGFGTRGTTVWHNGGAPGAAGELDINPKLGVVAVVLGNVDPPRVVPVVDAVLNALRVP
jgi:CubicO group peptidase (beta-lactamase class C family)